MGIDPCCSDPSSISFEIKSVIEMHSSTVDRMESQVVEIKRRRDFTLFNSSAFVSDTVSISALRAVIYRFAVSI